MITIWPKPVIIPPKPEYNKAEARQNATEEIDKTVTYRRKGNLRKVRTRLGERKPSAPVV